MHIITSEPACFQRFSVWHRVPGCGTNEVTYDTDLIERCREIHEAGKIAGVMEYGYVRFELDEDRNFIRFTKTHEQLT